MSAAPRVLMYSTAVCPYCIRAEQLLRARGVAEIEKVVASATGLDQARGDIINVSSVEFIDGLDGVQVAQSGMLDTLGQHLGTIINAAAFIIVAFLVAYFGLRPMMASLTQTAELPSPSFEDVQRSLPTPDFGNVDDDSGALPLPPRNSPLDELRRKLKPAPQERLARMVDLNEERTALILRKWAHQEVAG